MNTEKKSEIAKKEEEILEFWQKKKIFEKTLAKNKGKKAFAFYDGPPFATGIPHYGHLLASTLKDVIPRYQTMRGRDVERIWGWDCHGLPIENLIEKEAGLNSKQEIEDYGIGKFNKKAQDSVLRYEKEWKEIIPRLGRWVDMENDYKTMDSKYTESVWWAFSELYRKGLAYEGHKSMHLCPRCETTLSNFEVNQGYKDIKDISVTIEFELEDEKKTFLLAWTTTPWTLFGNVALAVGDQIDYVTVEKQDQGFGEKARFILAKDKLEEVFEGKNYSVVAEYKGSELVGKKYKPLFNYYSKNEDLENRENGWKIYSADFVNTEEGTGIVHLAPAFGEDDMEFGKKKNLPFIQHVGKDGKFKEEMEEWAGKPVKPKEDHLSTDIEIVKKLAEKNRLFSKKKVIHSYPHCWRCATPLINYATNSWFIAVTKMKLDLIRNNKMTNWVPEHMRDGRFGKWLENVIDWGISRSRYWGAPLPVWEDEDGKRLVIDSVATLKKHVKKSGNKYYLMRHGESDSNVSGRVSCVKDKNGDFMTKKGKEQVKKTFNKLEGFGIDLIITSPFTRTKETAKMIAEKLDIDETGFIEEDALSELNAGDLCGNTWAEYHKAFKNNREYFTENPHKGETWRELKNRVSEFLYEIEEKYKNKKILIIGHDVILRMILAGAEGYDINQIDQKYETKLKGFDSAEVREMDFTPIPHNFDYELDLHRPYIDEIELVSSSGAELKRVEDVFDCWFESGSMPYASLHYPFENRQKLEARLPADFIAEGVDQTRGWFYSLLVLSTGIFGKPSSKNIIVNGLILAEDGQKMSKSLNNYPDVESVLNTIGSDALRLFFLTSPVGHAEDVSFSVKNASESYNKVVARLRNILSLYQLYFRDTKLDARKSPYVLDKWIIIRLDETLDQVTKALDDYLFDKATRPLFDFMDDFSNWYIRRSRDRFKEEAGLDYEYAIATTRHVLLTFSKIIAPMTPFVAEEIYNSLTGKKEKESVHLESWPVEKKTLFEKMFRTKDSPTEKRIMEDMELTRYIVSTALESRASAGIKVRQPLKSITIYPHLLKDEYIELIKAEVNIKSVKKDETFEKDQVQLNTQITPDLVEEGMARELLRNVQKMRKEKGLVPKEQIILSVFTDDVGRKLIDKFEAEIKTPAGIKEIKFVNKKDKHIEVEVGNYNFALWIL